MSDTEQTAENKHQPSPWAKYPRAPSLESAEAAQTFYNRTEEDLKKRVALAEIFETTVRPGTVLRESVARAWETTPRDERQVLPQEIRREISEQLPPTTDGNRLRTEVFDQSYPKYEMNPAYARWQQAKTADLLDRLEKSPVVRDTEKSWDSPAFGVHEKIKFAQELHNIHAETFGFKPKKVEPYIEGPSPTVDAHGNISDSTVTLTSAYVSDPENRMAINIYRDDNNRARIHGSFASFVETVVHEGEHVFQGQLADRVDIIRDAERVVLEDLGVKSTTSLTPEGKEVYDAERERRIKTVAPDDPGNWNPELSGDGALAGHAEYMRHNKRYSYMAAEDPGAGHEGYLSNPMEQESREIGAVVGLYFDQPAKDRSNFIAEQRYGSHLNDVAETERLQKREAATRKPDAFTP